MKAKSILFLLATAFIMVSCQQSQATDSPKVKEGMIKFAIFYPNGEDKTFDMDYYSNKHMPMAAELFGDALKAMSIDKGIANGTPDTPVKYLAIGYFYFDSMDALQNTMGQHRETLRADVPNYTNIIPETQISEVQRAE